MPDYIRLSLSRLFLFAVAVVIVSAFCISTASAGTGVFSGVTSYIIPDKYCKDKPEIIDLMLVFDGEPDALSSGLFYGKETMTAVFKRVSPSLYDVTYSNSKYEKMHDSKMELLPYEDGFRAIIKDYIPEQKQLREDTCFYEKFEVVLKPTKDSVENIKTRAKELFTAEVLSKDAEYLLHKKKDYLDAMAKGYMSLEIAERIYGKYSKEALNYSGVIIFSLINLDRYNDALDIVVLFRKSLPDNATLKEMETLLQIKLKNQKELATAELLTKEGDYLLHTKLDYWGAIAKANKALEILEPIYGKYSEGTTKASFLIIFSLYSLHRYDEALAVLEPYKNEFPEIKDLKDFEDLFQKQLKEQNELFRSDPDSDAEIAFESLG